MWHKLMLLITTLLLILVAVTLVTAQTTIQLPLSGRTITELLTNGGMETDSDADKVPDDWEAKNITLTKSDKIKCDKPDQPVAHTGNCAFMFRGNANGTTSTLSQNVPDISAVTDGMTLQFSGYIDPRSATPGVTVGKVTVKLSTGDPIKLNITIPGGDDRRGVADYVQMSMAHTLTLTGATVTKIKVKLLNNQTSGKFLIDDVSLTVFELGATETPTDHSTSTPEHPTATPTLTHTPTNTPTPCPSPCKLFDVDGAETDYFGYSVAVSGNTAVVGAPGKDDFHGTAYIYSWDGVTWIQQAKLKIIDDHSLYGEFGSAVAISGDTVVIGAPGNDRAYVFTRTGDIWTEQQKLTASDAADDRFGSAVAVYGDTAIVGAPNRINQQGAAYVFTRTEGIWTEQQILTASDAADGDQFGFAVTISEDTVIIGAFGKDLDHSVQGAAYVFTRTGDIWTEQQMLTASDAAQGDFFGLSVALSANTAAIGAPYKTSGHGAAYIFTRTGDSWSEQQKLVTSDTVHNYGFAIDVHGDTTVIGAPGTNAYQGAAYVFKRTDDIWTEQPKLTASDGIASDEFGDAVGLDGTITIIGSPKDEIGTIPWQGSAWVFTLP